METVDCQIDARWVIPVEPQGLALVDHSVVVRDGLIVAILPTIEADQRYTPTERCALPSHALIPGLVNLHGHAAMTLMRGLADDIPLIQWLEQRIWPAEARHVSADFVFDGSLLACREMLLGGTTTFNDMYFFPEATARAAVASGMRAAIGLISLDFPTPYAADAEDYLQKGLAARDSLRGNERLSFCMAPHAPYSVSDRSLERVLVMAEELDLPIHIHLHETAAEITASLDSYGVRPLERLRRLGLLGTRLIGVHSVHMDEGDLEAMARAGASIAHCPSSNLKLASGIAPVAGMIERGITVGLGTDGAASNNRLDMFQEMRLAALLAKGSSGNARAVPAETALSAATIAGARALGLDRQIGSLLPGKAADLCAVRMDSPQTSPCYDPVSHLVYVAGRENVSHVWVEGRPLVHDGELIAADEYNLSSRILLWQNKLVAETIA